MTLTSPPVRTAEPPARPHRTVEQRTASSLHARRHPELLRGLAAAVTLLGLLVAPPLLLAATGGWPLPAHMPAAGSVADLLSRPIDDRTLLAILTGLAWLAWAQLLVAIAAELAAQLTGRGLPRHLPVFGVNQQLAHRLVAAALLLLPATAPHLAAAGPLPSLTRVSSAVSAASPGGHDLQPVLADTADPGSVPAVQVSAAPAAPAEVSDPPVRGPAPWLYVVQPPEGRHHDSLWDIADRYLNDGRRYHELYDLNCGRPQPDGRSLTRASLIRPGWELLLPSDATGPGLRPLDAAHDHSGQQATPAAPQPEPADTAHEDALVDHPGAGPAGPDQRNPGPAAAAATVGAGAAEVDRSSPAAPATAQPRPHRIADARPHEGAGQDDRATGPRDATLPLGLGLGALAALAAVARARAIAQRRRPPHTRLAPLPEPLTRAETALRREARTAADIAGTVRLACAMTAQAATESAISRPLRIHTVRAHDSGDVDLLLQTATQPVPAPFLAIDGGWQLPARAGGFTFATGHLPDPVPTLAPVGRSENAALFVDLADHGLLAVTGRQPDLDRWLATVAGELAGAPWAGVVRILLPPALADQVGPLERVEPVEDLADQLPRLLRQHDQTEAGADDAQRTVLIGWDADQTPDLLAAAALDPRRGLTVLSRGPHPQASVTWQLHQGQLTGAGLDNGVAIRDRGPAADAVPALLEHLRAAPTVPENAEPIAALRQNAPASEPSSDDDPMLDPPTAISIDVLGPVGVSGAPPPRRTPVLQTLVYLALHRRGVDAGELATALWPETTAASQTLRNRVAEARTLADGAITPGPRWRLEDRVTSDWQLFQALAAGDPDQQQQALTLVRGRPFQDMLDAEWIDTEGLRTEIEAAIVDLALDVATRALNTDNPGAAFHAARAGLRASPYEERLFRLAMRAADAEGSTGKLRGLMRELRTVLDIEIEPDASIDQETIELYQQLLDRQRPSVPD